MAFVCLKDFTQYNPYKQKQFPEQKICLYMPKSIKILSLEECEKLAGCDFLENLKNLTELNVSEANFDPKKLF